MELWSVALIIFGVFLQFCYIEGAVTETPASVTFSGSGAENPNLKISIPKKIKRYALPVLGGAVLIGIACCYKYIKKHLKRCCQGLKLLKEVIIHKPAVTELTSGFHRGADRGREMFEKLGISPKKQENIEKKTSGMLAKKKKKKGVKRLYTYLKKKTNKNKKKWKQDGEPRR